MTLRYPRAAVLFFGFVLPALAWSAWSVPEARAQFYDPAYETVYRPPGARYWVYESPHFDVIFEEGLEGQARETAAIMEAALPGTRALVGHATRFRMPVVLNGFNDRSNGYVTPLPFKQEIEGTAIKGKILSPGFTSWMEAVGPHELAHAVHADRRTGLGVGGLLRPFAPDMSRLLHLTGPPGINEGLAVYRESMLRPGAGRLHFSPFTMRFRAAMLSDDPWSLAQLVEAPAFSQPGDRFYLGGSHLFAYLAEREGERFFRRADAFYHRFPFLGYGPALWYGAGRFPYDLGRRFRRDIRRAESARLEAAAPFTPVRTLAGGEGLQHRGPRWMDDSTLVAYVVGYATRPGFYRLDARTGRRTAIGINRVTEDYVFELTADSAGLLYARYVQDPLAALRSVAEVFRLDLQTGRSERLTHEGRVAAPVEAPGGGRWAVRNDGQFTEWVRIADDGAVTPVADLGRLTIRRIAPSPDGATTAAVLNIGGRQGVFHIRAGDEAQGGGEVKSWVLFEKGFVYDATWSSDGRYLVFAADPGGIANIYALDVGSERLWRVTNVPYGAFEPALSPDGRTLAFVNYRHTRYDLVTLPFDPAEWEEVPRAEAAAGDGLPWDDWRRPPAAAPLGDGAVRPYRSLRHLAPRMAYPLIFFEEDGALTGPSTGDVDARLGLGLGLGVQGVDPLETWAYRGDAFYRAGRLWGRAALQTSAWALRPYASFYDLPSTLLARQVRFDEGGAPRDTVIIRVGKEELGAAAGLYLPVTLRNNIYRTTASAVLQGDFAEDRLFDEDRATIGRVGRRFTLRPSVRMGYRVQQNLRDLLPNTGLRLLAVGRVDAWRRLGDRDRQWFGQADVFLPWLRRWNGGLRVRAALLDQNRGGITNLDLFMPRGYEDRFLGGGTFLQYGVEYVQPLWFIDDGLFLLPIYFSALHAYTFAETLQPLASGWRLTSAGGGLGLQFRLFYRLDLALRVGAAYRFGNGGWTTVYR